MHDAEFAVDLYAAGSFAGDPAAEVVSDFVLVGADEVAVQRDAYVRAAIPPLKECVAGRARNGSVVIKRASAMIEAGTEYQVASPIFGDGDIYNRPEREPKKIT